MHTKVKYDDMLAVQRKWMKCLAIRCRFFCLYFVVFEWEIVHEFHRLLCRLLDSPFVAFCVFCDVDDVVGAVAVAVAASALFGRFRRIFNTCPRVQFPARLAPLLTCWKNRLNNAVTSNIDILNTVNFGDGWATATTTTTCVNWYGYCSW